MLVTWVDLIIVVVILGFVMFEVRRDFGQTLLDTLVVVLCLRLTTWLSPAVAQAVPIAISDAMNRGVWYMLFFVLLVAGGLFLARWAHEATRWSLDTFDPAFGFVFGLTSAVLTCHVCMKAIAIAWGKKHGLPPCIVESALGQELLTFKSYQHLVVFLSQFPRNVSS
jgi:uncharacterized membrane protein required for colicin V production